MAESTAEVACRAMAFALGEYRNGREARDDMRIREAAEKAWLAVVQATDHYLVQVGVDFPVDLQPAELHRFRRKELEDMDELGHTDATKILKDYLDLRDSLHGDCFHGGACDGIDGRIRRAGAYVSETTGCEIPRGM